MQGASRCGWFGYLLPYHGHFPRDQSAQDGEVDCQLGRRGCCYFRGSGTRAGRRHHALHNLEMGVLDQVSV